MKRVLLLVVVCLLFVVPVASAQVEIRSSDGQRSVTVFDDGRLIYQSANGTLNVQVTKTGLRVGDLSIEGTEVEKTATGLKMRLSVKKGAAATSDVVEVNNANATVHGANAQMRKMLKEFAKSSDGYLLNEARELIVQNLETGRVKGNGAGSISSEWSTYGCGADLLNAVAAGTAMIGGCASGGWFCASGVAWYGSSLIQLATGGECVFM